MSDLDVFVGAWRTEGTIVSTGKQEAERLVASDVYEWFPGGKFLLHHVDGSMGSNPVRALEIIRSDDAGNLISQSIDNSGSYSEYRLRLEGRKWSIDGASERFEGKFNDDFTLLEGQWFAVSDEGAERPWMQISLKKIVP